MGNILNLMQIIGLAKQNPKQAIMNLLNNGLQNGTVNKQQYDLIMGQIQNGANPNQIIQQMMNAGIVNQQMYEDARRNANNFRGR